MDSSPQIQNNTVRPSFGWSFKPVRPAEQADRWIRMEAKPGFVQLSRPAIRSPQYRSVCFRTNYPVSGVQQQILRSRDGWGRRTGSTGLGGGGHNNFVNPPFRMISRVLDVVQEQRAVATIIAPKWPAQPWYGRLQRMCVSPPIKRPNNRNTVIRVGALPEPLKNRKWELFAWRIYGGID